MEIIANSNKSKQIKIDDPVSFQTARRVLSKEINAGDADDIYRIFEKATYDHVKINSCVLLCSLSKWSAIRYIIEFCADRNESISLLGQSALEGWKLRHNQSFTTPSSNQIEEIREVLECFGQAIKESDRDFIEFCIRDFINKVVI